MRSKVWLVVVILAATYTGAQSASYPTMITLTPASSTQPCLAGAAAASKGYTICGQNNSITVDFGDGKGYVSGTGAAGPPGKDGVNGTSATVTVGTTTTGPVASVKNSGTTSAAVFDFVLPVTSIQPTITCATMTVGTTGVVLGGCK